MMPIAWTLASVCALQRRSSAGRTAGNVTRKQELLGALARAIWNGLNGVSGVDTERVATQFLFLARAKWLDSSVTFPTGLPKASWTS